MLLLANGVAERLHGVLAVKFTLIPVVFLTELVNAPNMKTKYKILAAQDIVCNVNRFVKATVKVGTLLYPMQTYTDSEIDTIKKRGVVLSTGSEYLELTPEQITVEQCS